MADEVYLVLDVVGPDGKLGPVEMTVPSFNFDSPDEFTGSLRVGLMHHEHLVHVYPEFSAESIAKYRRLLEQRDPGWLAAHDAWSNLGSDLSAE